MRNFKLTILLLVIIVLILGYSLIKDDFIVQSFEDQRGDVVSELDIALEEAVKSGDYECCITPPCKMCFLGNWIWEDGRCDCDGEIAQGNWDNVCPECKKGIEEGTCNSNITSGTCLTD